MLLKISKKIIMGLLLLTYSQIGLGLSCPDLSGTYVEANSNPSISKFSNQA